jgi:DegV family protein with EDD domain
VLTWKKNAWIGQRIYPLFLKIIKSKKEMQMLHIVTDGAADMPHEWQEAYHIHVVPINIQFGEKTYLQYRDLDNEGFYRLVEESGKIPKTSQPSPYQFQEMYERIARPGDTILSIHVTSKLSGTFESAIAAARELAGKIHVIPFDSACGSAGLGFMCRQARLLERAGKSVEEILRVLEEARRKVRIVLTLDRLDYARMSGRVGALQASLASLLNVKPIVELKDGILEISEKVRTRGASLQRVLEVASRGLESASVYIAAVHARDEKSAHFLLQEAKKFFQNAQDTLITDLSIAVTANLGPGTAGIVVYPAE